MRAMTESQRVVVERLLAKGWIEPLRYRCCVYLFLPEIQSGRRGRICRDWRRKSICVTPTGNVLPGQGWNSSPAPADTKPLVFTSPSNGTNGGRARRREQSL